MFFLGGLELGLGEMVSLSESFETGNSIVGINRNVFASLLGLIRYFLSLNFYSKVWQMKILKPKF